MKQPIIPYHCTPTEAFYLSLRILLREATLFFNLFVLLFAVQRSLKATIQKDGVTNPTKLGLL